MHFSRLWGKIYIMRTLHAKKAVALYDRKLSVKYVVTTVIMYVIAALLWYAVAAVAPYTATVTVDPAREKTITREAFSAGEQQSSRPESEKERAFLMPSSEQTYLRRLKLVEDAQKSIDFMIYDSYEEDYTLYFYSSLLRAADRGIKVRILVDGKMGMLTGYLREIGELLQNHNNIEFYYYNMINLFDPAGLLVVMHDKVMLADDSIAIVGGVNMGRGAFTANYDMEVMITNGDLNGCAGQIKRYFEEMINSSTARRIVSNSGDLAAKTQYINDYTEFFEKCEYAHADIDYNALGVPVNKATFLNNGSEGNKKEPIIFEALCNLSESSRSTTVVTPYTLLENDKKHTIKRLASANERFRIITNSLYNTRNVAYADYYYTRKVYVDPNIELLEYQADNQLHAKMFTFDGRFSVIGSFNLDERSCHIDTESVVIIDSEAFAAIVDDYIEETFVKNSLKVGENNEYIPSDTVVAHEVPGKKRFLYAMYRALGIVRCLI